jgi:hypothetical protein
MNFRRWILATSVLALCVAGANAQINTGTGNAGAPFTCSATNGAVTPTVRSEGITELVGDIVIQCTGGATLAPGAQIPLANITVFLNTQVTSRLLGGGTPAVANNSEALLLIDEPNSGLAGYGPSVPITLCGNPAQGCIEFVGNTTGSLLQNPVISVPVATNPNTGVNGAFNPATVAAGANAFSGVVNPDGKSVTFFGVPIMPPATSGLLRQFRITNIRANASAVPAGANTPGNIQALVSISGSSFVPLTNSQLIVGYVVAGLTPSLRSTGNGGINSGSRAFNQCTSTTNNGAGTAAPILRYQSNFGTAFKTRVNASTSTSGQNAGAAVQNVPGSTNNSTSESGFILNGLGGQSQTFTGNGATAGLADWGTRFKAVFNNIPAGVSIFVSTTNLVAGTTTPVTGVLVPAPTNTTTSYAQLIVSDTSPENNAAAPFLTATGSNGGINFVALTPAAGSNSVTAVWEVINSNVNQNQQNFDFATFISYSSNVANNSPAAPSAISVSMSFAPISSTFSASGSAPIPRFIDLGTGDNLNFANISICTTALMFPYITTVTGFETGVAIANTTMDPFGTGGQSGTCNLYWYGNNNGGATNTPVPLTTTPTIAAGTVWTGTSGDAKMAGPGFTGYMIATCNFQLAHGSAFVTDIGSRGILSGYLALVINGRGQAGETFSH